MFKRVCLLFFMPLTSWAISFTPSISESTWTLSGDKFACSIVQPIPRYGKAEFFHEAGEDLTFRLHTNKNLMKTGKASVSVEPPIWLPGKPYLNMGYTSVNQSKIPLTVDSNRSNRLMQALMEGMQPNFTRKSRYDVRESISVMVSPANFDQYYEDYLSCIAGLLPVNFNQVSRTRVNFATGGDKLSVRSKHQLDMLALYVKEDPSVLAIYIDGHTDNVGRRFNNRQLSEFRSIKVSEYLQRKGLDESMITTRYHGERYPVEANKTKQGRAINRRVTVRLERGKENEAALISDTSE